jgi:hypothetical protein
MPAAASEDVAMLEFTKRCRFTNRRSAARRLTSALLWASCGVLFLGCGSQANPAPDTDVQTAKIVSTEPGEIELFDPRVTFAEPNLVRFEVRYRFTKGKPDRYYMCDVSFPGTKNHGAKPMDSWELKSEGVIKDGIVLSMPPVETFEIRMSEAVSPDKGYKKISNVVSGPVK